MLDTNVVSDLLSNPHGPIQTRVDQVDPNSLSISIIVAAELRFGVAKKRSARLAARVEEVLTNLPVLPFEEDADAHYAHMRADLERRGLPIGNNDLLIAAHALSLGATLVSDNVGEFARVKGLTVENWLRD